LTCLLLFLSTVISVLINTHQIKENEMGGACSMYGENRNAYRVLVRKPVGKSPLGGPNPELEQNIKKDLKETGFEGVYRTYLAHVRDKWWSVVSTVMNSGRP
jgi:hypothetical protein